MGVIDHDRQTGIQRLELLAALGDRIREIDDPGELAYAAAELLGRNLKISRAGYGTVDLKRETITIERDWNAPGIMFEDAEIDPRTREHAEALKAISAQSIINMPVSEHGGLVALFYLNHACPRR